MAQNTNSSGHSGTQVQGNHGREGPHARRRGRGQRQARGNANVQVEGANLVSAESGARGIAAASAETSNSLDSSSSNRQGIMSQRGAYRGRRGDARSTRGGSSTTATVVGSQRAFGGHLSSSHQALTTTESGLSAAAAESVPGRPAREDSRRGTSRISCARAGYRRGTEARTRTRAPGQRLEQVASTPGPKSSALDLPTRIQEDIDNCVYECVICTSEVVRTSRVWSCSVCWTVVHLKCVRKWHANQTKTPEHIQNETPDAVPGWRCPGCNSSLAEDPGSYHCWCGKESNPKPIPGLPSHSCHQTCAKPRGTCPHPCPLNCHAGPCPPCHLMGPTQSCFCGKHSSTKRCTETDYEQAFSCNEACGDLLPCGEHMCSWPCHSGLCGSCQIPILSTCYCGKEQREIPCDRRDDPCESYNHGQLRGGVEDNAGADSGNWFEGSFKCANICGRKFECGHHTCGKECHPQEEELARCPWSPDLVTHCACGKTQLDSLSQGRRETCLDPIVHCDKACDKLLPCGHVCARRCHSGHCSPCTEKMDVTCRCGRTVSRSSCHQGVVEHPICFRVCRAQLSCGRHGCGHRCCPGERKAAERRKRKLGHEDFEAEHICVQACGRRLKCGQHTCQQLCHKGACGSCLEAVFEDISCACGRTVLEPPQPCGTMAPTCGYNCTRPRSCGHPAVPHQCHLDDADCPLCAFLVEKSCICGKRKLKNQPCWFEEVRCGLPCDKKLKCGMHTCRKTCHRPGECEDAKIVGSHCEQPCGRTRKCCEHACVDMCYAPFACKEDKPCPSRTFLTCACQNRKTEVKCGATRLGSSPEQREQLKCNDECLRLERNRRLADALKIDQDTVDDFIPYSDTTLKLFRETGATWAQDQEREFRVFASDAAERRLRFKPMQPQQRAFVHSLAEDFGLDSESQDPAPHRHVVVFKTPRFVSAPRKTLAQCARVAKTAATLGTTVSSTPATNPRPRPSREAAYNALLLLQSRFGMTIEDVDAALMPELAAASRTLQFVTDFLPTGEVVVRAIPPPVTAASIATAGAASTPQAVEACLARIQPAVDRAAVTFKVAAAVVLCHIDDALHITRRDDGSGSGSGSGPGNTGWNAVVGRGSWRKGGGGAVAKPPERKVLSGFLALRKAEPESQPRPEKKKDEPVDEDWLAAAEKEEQEEQRVGAAEAEKSRGWGSK